MNMLAPADEKFKAYLKERLGGEIFRPLSEGYLREPRARFFAQDGLLVAPRNAQEVSRILEICAREGVGVVPYGGGTGLVGGQIGQGLPPCVILSLERMGRIRAFWPDENVLIAEAGATLYDIRAYAAEHDRLFALWMGSGGSCQIGGNLATNAGGLNVLRYGNARDQVLGLEAVFPDGQIWHGLSRLRKDNTGYNLSHLLIGSEGTLGVITAAALKLCARPRAEGAALFIIPELTSAVALLALAQREIGDNISAFELLSATSFEFVREVFPDLAMPFTDNPKWCVLIDVGVCDQSDPQAHLIRIFEQAKLEGLSDDGVIASSEAQRQEFWRIRELVSDANRKTGTLYSGDVSLPLSQLSGFVAEAMDAVDALAPFRVNCYGHVGDGSLHFNVFPPAGRKGEEFSHFKNQLQALIHDLVHMRDGSISAEHGIGRAKVSDLENYADPAKLTAMRAIKGALDPKGIMNPGAVLA